MIVNALIATGKHHRAGHLIRHYLWPLGGFIGVGAALGAVAAMQAVANSFVWPLSPTWG